jgi:hypothetical protein
MSLLKLWLIRNPVLVSYSICVRQGSSNLSGSQSALTCLCVCARAQLGLREFNNRWKNGKTWLLTMKYSHRGIEITSRSTGTVSGVKRKSPEEGDRTLGFQILGDGKCNAQKKAMK